MAKGTAKTPLMRQYHTLKQQAPDALLLFHLGDFFELFFEEGSLKRYLSVRQYR